MIKISATEARKMLPEITDRVAYAGERFCLTKHGREMACIISMEEMRILEFLEEYLELRGSVAADAEFAVEGTTGWEELKNEVALMKRSLLEN